MAKKKSKKRKLSSILKDRWTQQDGHRPGVIPDKKKEAKKKAARGTYRDE